MREPSVLARRPKDASEVKHPAVYILANQRNGTLYIGVTSNLIQRVWQHREGLADGFSKQHGVKMLVWYEQHASMESAISREKAMKKWLRKWKLATIEKTNPYWHDLWPEIIAAAPDTATVIPANAGIQNDHGAKKNVIPAHAGTQKPTSLDSRIRGNDEEGGAL